MRNAIVLWVPVMLLAGAIGLASPNPAAAQQLSASDEEARALFEAGRVAYANGRYEKALGHFQQAYDLSKRAPLLYNIANTLDRLRRDEEALRNFEEFVQREPNSQYAPAARERITFLREALAARQRGVAPPPEPPTETVPTPAETALAGSTPEESTQTTAPTEATTDEPDSGGSIAGKWWFWTAIGVVAAGTVVGIAVASGGGDDSIEAPLAFDGNTRDVRL